jgi:hypothetical protein
LGMNVYSCISLVLKVLSKSYMMAMVGFCMDRVYHEPRGTVDHVVEKVLLHYNW